MTTTINIVCPKGIETIISSFSLPEDWRINYLRKYKIDDWSGNDLALIYLNNKQDYIKIASFLEEVPQNMLQRVVLIGDFDFDVIDQDIQYKGDDIWSWPLSETLFISKMYCALKRNDIFAENARQKVILNNQKQLFLRQKVKLENIVKGLPFGILMVDTENQIVAMNRQAKQIIGVNLDDDVLTSGYLRDKIAYYPFDLVRGMKDDDGVVLEEELILPSGRFLSRIVLVKDYTHKVLGTLIIFQSIREGESYSEKAIELIDIVLHEVKTPITSIITSMEIINNELKESLNDRHKRILSLGLSNCYKLLNQTREFLDVSKIQSGQIELDIQELSLTELIEDVVESFSISAAEKDIIIETTFEHTSDYVRADTSRLRQVFNNLLSNAIKFSHRGHSILFSVQDHKKMNDYVLLTVRNFGPIIPKEDLSKIFDRFFRTAHSKHHDRIGSGLGLHITKSIITALKGEIWVESTEKEGTCFFITLPVIRIENGM